MQFVDNNSLVGFRMLRLARQFALRTFGVGQFSLNGALTLTHASQECVVKESTAQKVGHVKKCAQEQAVASLFIFLASVCEELAVSNALFAAMRDCSRMPVRVR